MNPNVADKKSHFTRECCGVADKKGGKGETRVFRLEAGRAGFHCFTARPANFPDRRYVLRGRDGDYVERVEGGGSETVEVHFVFTKDRAKAQRFTHGELWGQGDLAVEFACGFAGGKAERVR